MSSATVRETEATLRDAFETALEEGFYPQDGTYGTDTGGCCALGMLGVVQNLFDPDNLNKIAGYQKYTSVLRLGESDVGALVGGFDGASLEEYATPRERSFARLGNRLRADYFLCDGERPEKAAVHE